MPSSDPPSDEEIRHAERRVKQLRLRELRDAADRLSSQIDAHLRGRRGDESDSASE
jgi:hypothetical protein